jgi:DNA-binding protein H-NS
VPPPHQVQPDESFDDPLTARERAAVIRRIRTLVEFWAITPEELSLPMEALPAPPAPPPADAPVKYRHPVTGDTWNGVGSHPQWLRNALLKEGYTVEQLKPPLPAA